MEKTYVVDKRIIGVVGSRRRDSDSDYKIVERKFFDLYERGDWICSGLCPDGADRFAVVMHAKYCIPCLWFPANWKKYGKAAGFIRNTDIARESDVLIACVASSRTGGTEDTIEKFLKFHDEKDLYLV